MTDSNCVYRKSGTWWTVDHAAANEFTEVLFKPSRTSPPSPTLPRTKSCENATRSGEEGMALFVLGCNNSCGCRNITEKMFICFLDAL
ncbi:hypothetical protein PVAP13_3NG054300 [Panicum virgatum]|uniref:Uncharacterized protein n=1 Tax=Panicum virgatum TaxID=38727 RepID=A0A8T0U358_PANVG|nr:hypothetical protein PVAP13_3NG054300 [Panicum virgatum]